VKANLPNYKILIALIAGILVLAVGAAADDIVVDMDNFQEGDLVVDGFSLKGKTTLSIKAIGAALEGNDNLYAYAWILDSDSREPIWVMNEEDTHRFGRSDNKREFEDEISLDKGNYEAYFYAGQPFLLDNLKIDVDGLGDVVDLLDYIFDEVKEDRYKYYSEDLDDLMFRIEAPDGSFEKFDPTRINTAIVDFSKAGDDFLEKKGFTLKKDLKVKIIAIGEYISKDRMFVDHGYIINADNREKVWEMDKWNTSWAGGGRKNRGFSDMVELPKGNYVAVYRSDDSHAFGSWNVTPPYDPLHYGLAVYVTDKNQMQYVSDFEDTYKEPIVIQMTRVRDNEFLHKGFTLKKETDLRIVALGEYGYTDEFVDYGWIEDASTGEVVWKMTDDNTDHAGGARKNRKFDGVVTLPKGDYIAYYVSDDSHAYREWNDTSPLEPEMWGMTIYGVGKDFDVKSIPTFDELPESGNILVKMTGLGDYEDVHQEFTITKPTKVKISALGEGKGGEMYDYGWIEKADTREIVWEMTYRKTDYAGGAQKNRRVATEIYLDKGVYNAYFVTDDSHSFPNFNASRPESPQKWGMIISAEDK